MIIIYIFASMRETKAQANRRVRDAKIKEMWQSSYTGGRNKTVVAEDIAEAMNVHLSTVKNVIKKMEA